MRLKVNIKRNEKLVYTPVNKKAIKNIFCGWSIISNLNQQSHIVKNLSNLQKLGIFKIENSECDWTHFIGNTVSVCCYCECLFGYHKKKVSFCSVLYSYNPIIAMDTYPHAKKHLRISNLWKTILKHLSIKALTLGILWYNLYKKIHRFRAPTKLYPYGKK